MDGNAREGKETVKEGQKANIGESVGVERMEKAP